MAVRVLVICPDPMRRRLLARRARTLFPDAAPATRTGVIDGIHAAWSLRPDVVIAAGLPVGGRDGWRLPELREAVGHALLVVAGDPDGELGMVLRADVTCAGWHLPALPAAADRRLAARQ